jgi:hypothetical protein
MMAEHKHAYSEAENRQNPNKAEDNDLTRLEGGPEAGGVPGELGVGGRPRYAAGRGGRRRPADGRQAVASLAGAAAFLIGRAPGPAALSAAKDIESAAKIRCLIL